MRDREKKKVKHIQKGTIAPEPLLEQDLMSEVMNCLKPFSIQVLGPKVDSTWIRTDLHKSGNDVKHGCLENIGFTWGGSGSRLDPRGSITKNVYTLHVQSFRVPFSIKVFESKVSSTWMRMDPHGIR